MELSCPNNEDHREFIGVAHVTEAWVVNDGGDFLRQHEPDRYYSEVVKEPNCWQCAKCHTPAKVSG